MEAEHRRAADRHGLRYPSDLTDAEWMLIAPMIPPAKRGGRRREVDVREVLNGIFYVLSTGCQWQALPKDLPPKSTAHYYFMLREWDGTLERLHHALYVATREHAGREASPTAAIIDSQSAKAAQKGLRARLAGLRCGQEVMPKRHILVDTLGLLLNVVVHPADVQDRDGARLVLDRRTRRLVPFHRAHLRRCRLSGTTGRPSRCQDGTLARRDCQTQRTAQVRRPAQALDRRTHHRLDSATIAASRATSSAMPAPSQPSTNKFTRPKPDISN